MDYVPSFKASKPYICPPDAGPAWREAYKAGHDMAALEESLKLTPEERLSKHGQRMAEYLKREEFFQLLERGLTFIKSYHGHSHHPNH